MKNSQVAVDILDERFQPLEGYAREDCLPLTSEFHEKVKRKRVNGLKEKKRSASDSITPEFVQKIRRFMGFM